MSLNMHFRLEKLVITFSRGVETITFNDVTYFYGQMGSGKTSIARLINYCLGGSINLTPALLSEFVTATLILNINGKKVSLERPRESDQVIAEWTNESFEQWFLQLPASEPNGVVLPDTSVETLSDLLFYLSGIKPPKVRRSKIREDSELQRLSFRDIFWYCYIDQDKIDSVFFHLDEDAHPFKKLKSRDVLRFLLGFHQEEVAELEAYLQSLHIRKLQLLEASNSLQSVLDEANVGSEAEITQITRDLELAFLENDRVLSDFRNSKIELPHGTDSLKDTARSVGFEIESLNNAIYEVNKKIQQDTRHKNEIITLDVKIQRMASARAILGGVEFETCPRCTQTLPIRPDDYCIVCGQLEPKEGELNLSPEVLQQDAKNRIDELEDYIKLQVYQLGVMERRKEELVQNKRSLDNELQKQLTEYDSIFLSNLLRLEKDNSQIAQQIENYKKLILLPKKVKKLSDDAVSVEQEEVAKRSELKDARKLAEADLKNLDLLKELFLDCLLRSQIPGIRRDSEVYINPKDFLPIVVDPNIGDIAVTSFANLSSGGKKTLFKACFAIAVHRLAAQTGALLPSILIIDSPMKNISERENSVQFEHFHALIYELANDELKGTQVILIDKEYFDPAEDVFLEMSVRHMTLDNSVYPPLIPYYSG